MLEQDKDKYKFIKGAFSDGGIGRCAMGVVLSRYGWNGDPDVNYLIPGSKFMQQGISHYNTFPWHIGRRTNIDKAYSVRFDSPAYTYPVYNPIYLRMIKSFEVIPQN
jgi:hypothetical protein